MSNHARKKEKHRLKRLKKQREVRKGASITPLQRIAKSGGNLQCRINLDWKDEGMATVIVFGTAMDGRHALSVFLVDTWCVGLKDAWGRVEVSRGNFDKQLAQWEDRLPMRGISVEEARGLVAGAVRFSRQNGFKLPGGWEKWASILGDPGDIASADLSEFGKDGGLLYVGTEKFLRDRLIGCTPQEFFARPDVHFSMEVGSRTLIEDADEEDEDYEAVDDEDENDDSDDELTAEALNTVTKDWFDRIMKTTSKRCHEKGTALHPLSTRAAKYIAAAIVATALARVNDRTTGDPKSQIADFIVQAMQRSDESDPQGIIEAVGQIWEAVAVERLLAHVTDRAPTPVVDETPETFPGPMQQDLAAVDRGNLPDRPDGAPGADVKQSENSPSPAENPQHV